MICCACHRPMTPKGMYLNILNHLLIPDRRRRYSTDRGNTSALALDDSAQLVVIALLNQVGQDL